jgi:hypothetical protein
MGVFKNVIIFSCKWNLKIQKATQAKKMQRKQLKIEISVHLR